MRLTDPFDDEGFNLDFNDPTTRWLALALLLLAWLLICPFAGAQTCHYRHDGIYLLPDPHCTPGQANPDMLVDVHRGKFLVNGVEANICAKDFRTGPWRKVSESEKKRACAEYGITKGCPGPGYELDHLCSLEFGCSDSLLNLWPQPIKQARIKDHGTEDKLPKLICAGKISMTEAQKCIEGDWVQCAKKISALK